MQIVFESKIVEAKAKAELKKASVELEKVGRSSVVSTEDAKRITKMRIHSSEFKNEDLKDLKYFTELKLLEIFSFGLTDLQNLPPLEGLETLCIRWGDNPPIDPTPLMNCPRLKKLDWEGVLFTDTQSLSLLKKLRVLNLSYCRIDDLEFLRDLTSLTELKLCANRITDVSVLAGLKKLKIVNLQGNPITDITPLKSLPLLEYLLVKFENEVLKWKN